MIAEEILARARDSTDLPAGWVVFPLLRQKVILGIVGWALGMLLGLGLCGMVAPIVIPFNYEHGLFSAIFATILLGSFLFIGLGSAWTMISDIYRLKTASQQIIVITPEDFVQQAGKKITHVPLINIRYVTARGMPPPAHSEEDKQTPSITKHAASQTQGRGLAPAVIRLSRRRLRAPTSLAFLDTRTAKEVVLVNDMAHGDPAAIGTVLKQYAASVQ
ncbi:MAG: hypothetical protein E6J34_21840 [Chloroflexi bacterium]|nr:MAG: hypothetical protein E6J34_21840 [Chloroflexota bacterium]